MKLVINVDDRYVKHLKDYLANKIGVEEYCITPELISSLIAESLHFVDFGCGDVDNTIVENVLDISEGNNLSKEDILNSDIINHINSTPTQFNEGFVKYLIELVQSGDGLCYEDREILIETLENLINS